MNLETKTDRKIKEILSVLDRGIPLLLGNKIVQVEECTEHLIELQGIMSEELKESIEIVSKRREIIMEAHQEALECRKACEEEIQFLQEKHFREIESQPVYEQAQCIARQIIDEAKEEADSIRKQAETYCLKLFQEAFAFIDEQIGTFEPKLAECKNRIKISFEEKLKEGSL